MNIDNRIKKIIVIVLTVLLVFNTIFFNYKKSEAVALELGVAGFLAALLGAYGLSVYWAGNDSSAYDENYWEGLYNDVKESYNASRDNIIKLFPDDEPPNDFDRFYQSVIKGGSLLLVN